MNTQILITQAADLARAGDYGKVVLVCRKILRKNPKYFHALQLLGLAQVQQGQIDLAIKTLEKSCELDEKHAGVRINLANSYLKAGRGIDSLRASNQAVVLDPTKFEAFLMLGNALFVLKNYCEAEVAYNNVMRLNPLCVEAMDNCAECVKKQGRLLEAIALRFKANEINPAYTPIYPNLVSVLMYAGRREDALEVSNIGLQINGLKFKEKIDLWVGIARYGWLTGNVLLMAEALENSREIYQAGDEVADKNNLSAYHSYMVSLFKGHKEVGSLYQKKHKNILFFIAESHSLSAANVIVDFLGEPHKISSSFILGCKVWFLGRKEMNEYRASLAHTIAKIPEGASVVLGFGEIDCRASEGILLAHTDKGIDYRKFVPEMIDSYLNYALELVGQRQQRLLIYGVPAPSSGVLDKLDATTKSLLIDIVCFFNHTLKMESVEHGFFFIDVYAATVDEAGESHMLYHLDDYHLKPSAYPMLFNDYVSVLS